MDITSWMDWFLGCLGRAIGGAQSALAGILARARFWERMQGVPLNDRQRLVLNRLLDGWEGQAHDLKVRQARQVLAGHGRSVTFCPSSSWEFSFAIPRAAAVRAMLSRQRSCGHGCRCRSGCWDGSTTPLTGRPPPPLLEVGPHPEHFHDLRAVRYLVDQPVVDVDST